MNLLDLVFTTNVYWDVLESNLNIFLNMIFAPSNMGMQQCYIVGFVKRILLRIPHMSFLFHSSLQVFIILLPMIMVFFMDLNFTLNFFNTMKNVKLNGYILMCKYFPKKI